MDVVIAGGHGRIARRLGRLLAARGDRVRGLIRNPAQARELEGLGVEPVVVDLEQDDVTEAVAGADVVVFAAGAGPGSGSARKHTVDKGGALKLIDAARQLGIRRYVMISAMGVKNPSAAEGVFRVYLECKRDADEALMGSGLDYTIVRPGRLTDASGTGRIEVAEDLARRDAISREDVAVTLLGVLDRPESSGRTFEVLAGDTPVEAALDRFFAAS